MRGWKAILVASLLSAFQSSMAVRMTFRALTVSPGDAINTWTINTW
jgi:hypothetical protein